MKKSFMLECTSFALMLALSQLAMAKSVGTVIFSAGDVTISHADKTIIKAEKNAELNAGDAIETKEGRVQLSMIDGGKISLQPNTIYKINQFEFTGKEDGSEYNFAELVKGGLRTISGLIGHKNRDHYQLKTAVATIGIRGTEFTVNFNDNYLLMTTNHGSVDVCNAGGCLNAITGQSIQVTGIGGAPKPSDKAAKAAAAPPAPAKAVFAADEQINTAASTTTVTPVTTAPTATLTTTLAPVTTTPTTALTTASTATLTTTLAPIATAPTTALTTTFAPVTTTPTPTLTAGNDTIVSLAIMPIGIVDHNGVYVGTTSFKSNNGNGNPNSGNSPNGNALKQYIDNSGTPLIVTGTVLEATGDAFVSLGRASGGTYNGQPMLMTNWVTGIATPSTAISALNGAGVTGTYLVTNSTAPYIVSTGGTLTTGSPNTLTGGMSLNFGTYKLDYNLNIPIAGNVISIIGNNVSLAAGSAKFSDNSATFAGTSTGIIASGILSNNASVEGSLFGPNAERVGLQYGVQVTGAGLPGMGGNLYGSVVGTKQ